MCAESIFSHIFWVQNSIYVRRGWNIFPLTVILIPITSFLNAHLARVLCGPGSYSLLPPAKKISSLSSSTHSSLGGVGSKLTLRIPAQSQSLRSLFRAMGFCISTQFKYEVQINIRVLF